MSKESYSGKIAGNRQPSNGMLPVMPRTDKKIPELRKKLVRHTLYSVVTLADRVTGQRRDIVCGAWGTPESQRRYNAAVAAWLSSGRREPIRSDGLTVAELCARHRQHAEATYARGEVACWLQVYDVLCAAYASVDVSAFTVACLRWVREEMCRRGWVRNYVVRQTGRVRQLWRWAVSMEVVSESAAAALRSLEPLRQDAAEDSEKVQPVEDWIVEATLPFAPAPVAAVARLQRYTGARGGELLGLRPADIDRSGEVWFVRPPKHKTARLGKKRLLTFGPKAQSVLRPLLLRPDQAFLFSPRDARNNGRAGARYSRDSYRRALTRACDRADRWAHGGQTVADEDRLVPHWHPHQLRHTAATEIRQRFGLEAARIVLGHSSAVVTDAVYADRDARIAVDVARALG